MQLKLATIFISLHAVYHANADVSTDESKSECLHGEAEDQTCIVKEPTCKYYLAPSSIPNAGYGIYSAVDIPNGEPLTYPTGDAPAIVVHDAELHYGKGRNWNLVDYFWTGEGSGEFEADTVEESVVTFGNLCNYHTYLYNVRPTHSVYDDTITPRSSKSPGIGAYSYYYTDRFHATKDIKAGDEIFANYGEEWLESRTYIKVPLEDDFITTGEIIDKLAKGLDADMLDDSFLKIVSDVVGIFNKEIPSSLLPKTKDGIKSLVDSVEGDIINKDKIATAAAKTTVISRDMDWIISNGKCLDNVVPTRSTIPDAGNGGFAQRFIPKGESVIIAPLVHIMDWTSTFIYPLVTNENGQMERDPDNDESNGYQLMLNYCFSHDQSSMLLCPQTNSILINHCSTRNDYGGDCAKYNENEDPNMRGANAEVRWADDFDNTKSWLKMSIPDIDKNVRRHRRGLSMEFIAKRDIYPGDEIFIDYGEEWELEWEEHVKEWVPPPEENHASITEMNKMEVLRTPDELKDEPYSENVRVVCKYLESEDETDIDSFGSTDPDDWIQDVTEDIYEDGEFWPCKILSRTENSNSTLQYSVEFLRKTGVETIWSEKGYSRILHNMKREGIEFRPMPYSSDQHYPGAFRSFLRIPDSMFPEIWKDLPNN
mmetsp:Transcript_9120/g.10562  ORF Transcript_9120/g.10562 Transcript_9120/m.10562 type:complete len:653 (-) Transcript_9120:97-2055(-)